MNQSTEPQPDRPSNHMQVDPTNIVRMLSVLETNRKNSAELRRVIPDVLPTHQITTSFLQLAGDLSPVEWSGERIGTAQSDWDGWIDAQAKVLRSIADKSVILGVLTPDAYRVVIRSIDGKENTAPIQVTVEAPITNNMTVRPIIDMGGDKEIVYGRDGKTPVGIRRV